MARALRAAWVLLPCAALVSGCLGEPEIEDRWTRLDMLGSSLVPNQPLPPGSAQTITMNTAITYRNIVTGFAVAELRASGTISPADVVLNPGAPRERMALDIDNLLQNSVSVGRATRAITGWDHLIQHIDFTFTGVVPDTSAAGLFLLCYLGSGDEVRRADGTDTLVVTPFVSTQYEILPVGMELSIPVPGNR